MSSRISFIFVPEVPFLVRELNGSMGNRTCMIMRMTNLQASTRVRTSGGPTGRITLRRLGALCFVANLLGWAGAAGRDRLLDIAAAMKFTAPNSHLASVNGRFVRRWRRRSTVFKKDIR